jgi:hypothetical protein
VAKNKDIDRRMRKETDFKPKQNVRRICSYGDLDNIAYFCFFFWTPLAFFPDFTSFGKSTNSRNKSFFSNSWLGPVR